LIGFLKFLSFVSERSLSAFSKMSEDKKDVVESKLSLSEEKNLGFLELMAKTNIEKITREILEGLSEDIVFGKSNIKQSHLGNMRGRYFRDMSIVRADDGERTVPTPEENEL
jgi:hypothetical protein